VGLGWLFFHWCKKSDQQEKDKLERDRETRECEQKARENAPCPHGIQGGKTMDLCSVCRKENQEARNRLIQARSAEERRKQIKANAGSLKRREMARLAQARLSRSDFLLKGSPRDFEDIVAKLFKTLGYDVRQTPYSNDGGKDAVATKDGKKFLIECKRYEKKNLVGRPMLQKFYAAVMEEKADKGFFVTTSNFAKTAFAYEYVRSGLIELIDGEKLGQLMIMAFHDSVEAERYSVMCIECGEVVTFDLAIGETEKNCSNGHCISNNLHLEELTVKTASDKIYCGRCGAEMRRVNGRRGDFYGCGNYPRCKGTRAI
jgi:restriction system protein